MTRRSPFFASWTARFETKELVLREADKGRFEFKIPLARRRAR
jgi:hypothetical protein